MTCADYVATVAPVTAVTITEWQVQDSGTLADIKATATFGSGATTTKAAVTLDGVSKGSIDRNPNSTTDFGIPDVEMDGLSHEVCVDDICVDTTAPTLLTITSVTPTRCTSCDPDSLQVAWAYTGTGELLVDIKVDTVLRLTRAANSSPAFISSDSVDEDHEVCVVPVNV